MNKLEFFGVWNGSNFAEIVAAMYKGGYRTTKVYCYKQRIFIENQMISEMIIVGDPVNLPVAYERDGEEEEESLSREDAGIPSDC